VVRTLIKVVKEKIKPPAGTKMEGAEPPERLQERTPKQHLEKIGTQDHVTTGNRK